MEYGKIIRKLIGPVRPVGMSQVDEERLQNLKETCQLVESLVMDLSDLVHDNRDAKEHSVKVARDYAQNFLNELTELLTPTLNKKNG